MAQERKGAVTFKGNPLTLIGPELKIGDSAPDFQLLANDLSTVTLASSKGKTRLFNVVPSLDTPVCDLQTKRFNEESAKFPSDIQVLTVSCDLPFAQARWCGQAKADRIKFLSDHRDLSFGQAYGVLIKELRLLSRAIVVVDARDKISYIEVVKEVTHPPNYELALASLKQKVS
ncbi:MAG: thiol peroxidase [Chlamydiae bacterium]|nr:thiol peroxidase [Chlamydiota bacterium]MBI3277257.1 thiol peroxidase [Chlamydiota bacterium]